MEKIGSVFFNVDDDVVQTEHLPEVRKPAA
jgi:hypothetical protein